VRRVAFQQQIPLIDAEKKLPRGSENFADFSHLTDKGANELATVISVALTNPDTAHPASVLSTKQPEFSRDDRANPAKGMFAAPADESSIPRR
jgi:hypothetical protein